MRSIEDMKNCGIYDASIKRMRDILDKILLINEVNEKINIVDPILAQKLTKIIVFINNVVWANSKSLSNRVSGLYNEVRPGISSGLIYQLLSVKINNTLVNFPKYHIFKAFEELTGESFFNINKLSICNVPTSYYRRLKNKFIRNSNKRAILMQNESLEKYFVQKDIYEISDYLGSFSENSIINKIKFKDRLKSSSDLAKMIFGCLML